MNISTGTMRSELTKPQEPVVQVNEEGKSVLANLLIVRTCQYCVFHAEEGRETKAMCFELGIQNVRGSQRLIGTRPGVTQIRSNEIQGCIMVNEVWGMHTGNALVMHVPSIQYDVLLWGPSYSHA